MGVGYYDKTSILQESPSFKKWEPEKLRLETNLSFKNCIPYRDELIHTSNSLSESPINFSPRPAVELDAAALKLQKVYKSYRTRRNLADCAVVVEELWWKALDFATLKQSSISFFSVEEPESAASRWARARTRVAKVAKGLSKNEKAQKLALRHWLEAIDPRHRYGHNLNLYYDVWFVSQSRQPFFYWLDVGDGREVNLEKCPRAKLQRQCIIYLGPVERTAYEVIIHDGKLIYKQTGEFFNTVEGCKWIFVLSTSRNLYVGEKKKGHFQHSSFLAGGATTAAGRMVARDGVLEAIWPYSGHYHPTEENFMEFISFLEEHQVDLRNVKRCAIDDDNPSLKVEVNEDSKSKLPFSDNNNNNNNIQCGADKYKSSNKKKKMTNIKVDTCWAKEKTNVFELARRPLSSKWTTGAGPRIGCVREYPTELQFQALEQVNLSPRVLIMAGPTSTSCAPIIPSPRPSPKLHLSSMVANIGLPSPRTLLPSTN